jgi:FkbM family methyltransferase
LRQEKLLNKLHRSNRTAVAGVLPGLLARRRSGLPPLSSRDEAIERERDFANRSPAYRESTKIRPDDVLVTSDNIAVWLPATEDEETFTVPCLTLDHWLEKIGVDADEVSFVKTDTNGFELEVLRGAAHPVSKRLAVWQIEVAPSYMRRIDVSMDMLGDELRAGFTHFIDMSPRAPGKIVRPIGEFAEAMDYLEMIDISAGGKQQTDILCFNA